jgi:hypothetical protein
MLFRAELLLSFVGRHIRAEHVLWCGDQPIDSVSDCWTETRQVPCAACSDLFLKARRAERKMGADERNASQESKATAVADSEESKAKAQPEAKATAKQAAAAAKRKQKADQAEAARVAAEKAAQAVQDAADLKEADSHARSQVDIQLMTVAKIGIPELFVIGTRGGERLTAQ